MSGQRRALIVANDEYDQEALRNLLAPAADAEALGRVLADRHIGGFSVQVARNEPSYVIQAQIEELFAESVPDDVLLLHFSGHGLKNQSGELFFAASNTRPKLLGSTAVSADFVQRCMRAARSRSIVLLLDCCYGGAFTQGFAMRASGDVNVLDSFPQERSGGRGRAVITASNAMEYAFEGDQLADTHHPRPSVFTAALVEGLATGDADQDEDGWVSLDELYNYVFDKVRERNPHQTPSRSVEMQGELYLARSRRQRIRPAPLPPDLQAAVTDSNMYARLGAVTELRARLTSDNLPTAVGAYNALSELVRTDIRYIADPAADALSQAVLHPEEMELHFGERQQGSKPPHRVVRLLGPPIARACVPRASDEWIRVDEIPEGLDVSVGTSRVGRLHGSLELKGPAGEAVITIDIDLVLPTPQEAAIRHPASPANRSVTGPAAPARVTEKQPMPPATPEPAPAAVSEPGPAAVAESAPAAVSEPGPAAVAESAPAAVSEPSTLQAGQKVNALAFSPDGTRMAIGSRGSVLLWNLQALGRAELSAGTRDTVKVLAFSPDGALLAASSGRVVRVWDAATGQQRLQVSHDGPPVLAVAFSPDGARLATGDSNQDARIWDVGTGQRLEIRLEPEAAARPAGDSMTPRLEASRLEASRLRVNSAAFSPDCELLATGSRGTIRIRNLQMSVVTLEWPVGEHDLVTALAFSPDGTRLAGGGDQAARVWDAATGQLRLEVSHEPSTVLAVAFSPDGTRVATADSYQVARIWDISTGRLHSEVIHKGASVDAVAFSPDGGQLATGGSDKTVRIWDIAG